MIDSTARNHSVPAQGLSIWLSLLLAAALWIIPTGAALAAEGAVVKLPEPDRSGGRPLMAALHDRRSDRNFADAPLSDEHLANILWSAVGVTRPDENNRRTTPTAMDRQDVEVYLLTEKGAFKYDALKHQLVTVADGDQTKILQAPAGLVFVVPADNQDGKINVGYCSQSVYLYAASAGLNTVAKVTTDRPALIQLLNLSEDKAIILAQPVGARP